MRLLTTILLGAISLVLAAVIQRVNERPVSGRRAADLANVLVRFEPTEIHRIEIESALGKAELEKRDEQWFFLLPEEDRADSAAVLGLLDRLNHLGIVESLDKAEGGDEDAAFGLNDGSAIHLHLFGEKTAHGESVDELITLGAESPRTGSIYARRSGSSAGSFVVDGNPRPWVEKPMETLRDRRLLPVPIESIVQVVLRTASGEISVQRRVTPPAQDWAISAPLVSWADKDRMDQLLAMIGSLRIEEALTATKAEVKIPNPVPADAAVLQFRIVGVDHPLTLFLKKDGKAEDGRPIVEAHSSDRPVAYHLHSDCLDQLPKSVNDLRDRSLARLPMQFVDSIRIQSRVDPLVDLRGVRSGNDVSWRVALGGKLLPANSAEVSALLATMNEAVIQQFVSDQASDLSEYGLVPPQRRISFQLTLPGETKPDGTTSPERKLTRTLDLGWKDGQEGLVYANFSGEPHVYQLDPTFLNLVPTHPVKWKSLSILTFNPIHLRSISREMPQKEQLRLDYDYRLDQWKASRNGVDVTPSLDPVAARRLADRLGALTARGWYLSLGAAYEALRTPSVVFQVVTSDMDPATRQAMETTHVLEIAAAGESLYFGRITEKSAFSEGSSSPDVFILDHEIYRELIRPVTTPHLPNR